MSIRVICSFLYGLLQSWIYIVSFDDLAFVMDHRMGGAMYMIPLGFATYVSWCGVVLSSYEHCWCGGGFMCVRVHFTKVTLGQKRLYMDRYLIMANEYEMVVL